MPRKKQQFIVLPEQRWQLKRTMSALEFRQALRELKLTVAAASRVLGISRRTASRYAKTQADIPAAHALLLRTMIEYNVKPLVPLWSRDDN